jgi:hypothetical protein
MKYEHLLFGLNAGPAILRAGEIYIYQSGSTF